MMYTLNQVNNLTHKDRIALKTLKDNPHIIIHSADKNITVVVMDRGLYDKFVLDMLADVKVYSKLTSDPTV